MKTPGVLSSLVGAATLALALAVTPIVRAADHGDAPTLGPDQGCDIADVYAFLDPGNNDFVVLIATLRGFIVPAEAGNFALFDPTARFTFQVENTGDSKPDLFIDAEFSKRFQKDDASFQQNARITFRGATPSTLVGNKRFHATVYQPTLAGTANPQAPFITVLGSPSNPTPGITFFGGEVDDPFFFDIPGFSRFVQSVLAGAPDPTRLDRARDSFAGYNVMAIALRLPASSLIAKPKKNFVPPTTIGVNFVAARANERTVKGEKVASGVFNQVDRIGVPGINVAFIPYNDKNSYNGASTVDDGKGKFAAQIGGTLTALGTTGDSLAALAGVAGLPNGPTAGTGDFLRLETNKALKPNDGVGGAGSNANGFPNGRRPGDDVIDTVLFLVTNGANAGSTPLTTGDKVNANDVPLQATFPFLALPQQPREGAGNVEDNTRN